MKFFNFLADILQINDNPQTRRREPAVFIVVHRPGQIGHQPCVPVKAVSEGFDWDSGAILIYPEVQLTELTAEQVNDITQSVRKGQSWHAMEQFKQYRERLDQAALEHARLLTERDQLAAENVAMKAVFSQKEIPSEAVDAFMDTAVMDHDWNETSEWSWVENETEVIHAVLDALKPETPATDRIYAGIKAEGAEACVRELLTSDDNDFIDAPNICAMVAFQFREGAK